VFLFFCFRLKSASFPTHSGECVTKRWAVSINGICRAELYVDTTDSDWNCGVNERFIGNIFGVAGGVVIPWCWTTWEILVCELLRERVALLRLFFLRAIGRSSSIMLETYDSWFAIVFWWVVSVVERNRRPWPVNTSCRLNYVNQRSSKRGRRRMK